jgi:hypothetical protein
MGAFDEHIKEALKGRWRFNAVGKIEEVTYHEPTANDAEIVFTHGLASANTPDKHQYVKGQYVEIDEQERFATLRTRAIENGMKMLRKHIYDTNDGYEKITVSSV